MGEEKERFLILSLSFSFYTQSFAGESASFISEALMKPEPYV